MVEQTVEVFFLGGECVVFNPDSFKEHKGCLLLKYSTARSAKFRLGGIAGYTVSPRVVTSG